MNYEAKNFSHAEWAHSNLEQYRHWIWIHLNWNIDDWWDDDIGTNVIRGLENWFCVSRCQVLKGCQSTIRGSSKGCSWIGQSVRIKMLDAMVEVDIGRRWWRKLFVKTKGTHIFVPRIQDHCYNILPGVWPECPHGENPSRVFGETSREIEGFFLFLFLICEMKNSYFLICGWLGYVNINKNIWTLEKHGILVNIDIKD